MKHLLDSARQAIKDHNWYAALMMALSFPDICGKLEQPGEDSSKRRYVAWFEKNLSEIYSSVGPDEEKTVFLSALDCYLLRCAFHHEGELALGQKAVLERIVFIKPGPGIHRALIEKVLVLQIDMFAEEVCAAVEKWLTAASGDKELQGRIDAMPHIYELGRGMKLRISAASLTAW